jgi:hypothetical protein
LKLHIETIREMIPHFHADGHLRKACLVVLNHRFEEFCGITFTTSEQHVELRKSRQLRDNQDVRKLVEWLTIHSLPPRSQELMSIGSGVVSNDTINCDSVRQ